MPIIDLWYGILNALIRKDDLPLAKLEEAVKSSGKTIKKHIDLLNDQLSGIASIRKTTKGYRLYVDDLEAFRKLMSGNLRMDLDFNSSGKRVAFLLKRLIEEDDYLIVDDLAEELEVSRSTFYSDLNTVKKIIANYPVAFLGVPNRGIKLTGSEASFRLLLLHHVYDYYSSEYMLHQSTVEQIGDLARYYKLDQTIHDILLKLTSITVGRIHDGACVEEEIPFYANYEIGNPFLLEFLSHIEQSYALTLSQYDSAFLSFPLNTRNSGFVEPEVMAYYEKQTFLLFQKMISEVKSSFVLNIDDNELFKEIKYHLMFMVNRAIFHVNVHDIFADEIEKKYPFSYELASLSVGAIEAVIDSKIQKTEISYLAIYFELSLNHKKEGLPKKVALICDTGKGSASLIKQQIKSLLGEKIEIFQLSEKYYEEEVLDDFFAVFTTMPIREESIGVPVLRITNLFDDISLREEWKKIKSKQIFENSQVIFTFRKLDEQKSYKENVGLTIDYLTKIKQLSPTFKKRWEKREESKTTVFTQGVAFPHAVNETSAKIVFSIGTFSKPVFADGRPVSLVFLVGIPEHLNPQTEKTLMEIYDFIFFVAKNASLMEDIQFAKNKSELMKYIEKKEMS